MTVKIWLDSSSRLLNGTLIGNSFISCSSATAVVEAAMAISYPYSIPMALSRQQVISCVNEDLDPAFAQGLGCGGGNSDDGFAFMSKYTFVSV